jgi:hypothetical protein
VSSHSVDQFVLYAIVPLTKEHGGQTDRHPWDGQIYEVGAEVTTSKHQWSVSGHPQETVLLLDARRHMNTARKRFHERRYFGHRSALAYRGAPQLLRGILSRR